MAREIFTLGGQLIGASLGGPFGAIIGSAIGGAIGNAIDPIEGPGIGDRKVQISTYGANRAMLFGTVRTAGILEWAAPLEEADVGGKGGPEEGPIALGTFFVTLSRTRCKGIRKAWANGVLVYDDVSAEDKPVADPISFAFYPGDEDQLPDPTMESYEGVGNVPAYRGVSGVLINRMDLSRFGNRLPSMEFEVVAEQEWVGGTPDSLDDAALVTPAGFNWRYIFYRQDGNLLLVGGESTGAVYARVYDPIAQTYGDAAALTGGIPTMDDVTDAIYVPDRDTLYLCGIETLATVVYEVSGSSFAVTREWTVSNTAIGTPNIPPAGVPGGYLAFDPFFPAINVTFASQFTSGNIKRIDLDSGIVGYAGSTTLASFAIGMVRGGRHVQIACHVGSFAWLAITPPLNNPYLWAPADDGMGNVEEGTADTAVTSPVWPTGGSTATGTFPRGAYDTGRQRYVIVDSVGKVWTVTDEEDPVVTYHADTAVAPSGNHDVMYMSGLDAVVVMGANGSLWVLDATDFSVLFGPYTLPDASGGLPAIRQSQTDPGAIIVAGGPSLNAPYRLYEQPLYSTTVGAAVLALGLEAGYEAGDLDVSELTQRLRGFRVVNPGAMRPAVEQLASVFHFEGAEEDDQIVFKMRGRASVATFTADECVVENADDQPVAYTRAQEATLPRALALTAPDILSDYQPLTQSAQRQAVQAGDEVAYTVDVVLTPTECKRAADALIFDAWMAREASEATLTAAALRLAGGDVITVAGRRARVVGKTVDNMAVKLSLVADDEGILDQTAAGVLAEFVRQTTPLATLIGFEILSTPLLRDQDDEYGAYWAAWARTGAYKGARLLRSPPSTDGTYSVLYDMESEIPPGGSTAGVASTALGDWDGRYMVDETNTVTVRFYGNPPASCTRDDMLAGANAFMVGAEMLHAMNVVAQGDGTHKLSGLLRVRRGTEQSGSGHAVGEPVVLLTPGTIGNVITDISSQGLLTQFAALGVGDSSPTLDDVATLYTARRILPLAPVDVRGSRDPSTNDLTVTWCRRSRKASTFTGAMGVNVPLGETAESYLIEFYDTDGGTLGRSVTSSTPTVDYTDAEQTADFGSTPATVFVRIAQTSDRVPPDLRWFNSAEATV